MNNDTNNSNNFNGQVLGNVNNNVNNGSINEPESLEVLDINDSNNSVMYNSVNNMGMESGNGITNQSNVLSGQQVQSVSSIEPEPAYTNPQNINPMPGFENSNTIGTTPPISLEPEKQPKQKKSNKTLFVIIVIILLFGVGFGTYYVLNYTDLLSKNQKVEIKTKEMKINLDESLPENINEYATVTGTDIKSCILNTLDVNVKKEGTYTYQISCGEVVKKGTIIVVDNKELEVETQTVYKVKGDSLEAKEFIVDVNDSYTYDFVNKEVIDGYLNGELGTYSVEISVKSGTKNKNVEGKLVILEYKIVGYLTCSSKEQNVINSGIKKIVKEEFAIAGDGNNGFGKVANEIYEFKFTDETEYTNYVASYKTENTISIDNITGDVKFDDENLTITITNSVNEDDLFNKYGESNVANYRSIRNYFIGTLGYECSYRKVEN